MTRSTRALSCKGIDHPSRSVIMMLESAPRHSNLLRADGERGPGADIALTGPQNDRLPAAPSSVPARAAALGRHEPRRSSHRQTPKEEFEGRNSCVGWSIT